MTEKALTIWIDESTDIKIEDKEYNLIGYLITNSDSEEFQFLNELRQSRKKTRCFKTLHGNRIKPQRELEKIDLIASWLDVFQQSPQVFFHAFLYKKESREIQSSESYEHYFAKKSVASIANKMKEEGFDYETWFQGVKSVKVLFDRRRAHHIEVSQDDSQQIILERLNSLENVYKKEIKEEIEKISGRDIALRFSFLSADCFDAMQLSDIMIYLIRHKIQAQYGIQDENIFTQLFDTHFINSLDEDIQQYSLMDIYQYDKKMNFYDEIN